MKDKEKMVPHVRILVVAAVYVAVILLSLVLGVTHQIAGWVAQLTAAACLLRLAFLAGWGVAKSGKGWRV